MIMSWLMGKNSDSEKITILMNKPSGVICSHNDSGVLILSPSPTKMAK